MVPSGADESVRRPGHRVPVPAHALDRAAWALPGAVAVLGALYFAYAPARFLTWLLIGLAGAGGLLAGIAGYRPARRAPWLLLTAALAVFLVTDALDNADDFASETAASFPTAADGVSLAAYPLAAAGLWLFVRHQRGGGRGGVAMVDAVIVTLALGLLAWTFLIWPTVDQPGRTVLSREVSVCYLLGDVLLLVVLARLLAGSSTRPPASWLLAAGTVGLLVSDVVFELDILHGSYRPGGPADLGWMVFYAAWGCAGLHPSMTRVGGDEVTPHGTDISVPGLTLLAASSLVAPAVLLGASLHGRVGQAGVLAGFAAASTVLVVLRMGLVLRDHRRVITRATAVRVALASLVAAVDVDEVARAVERGSASLLGPDAGRISLLTGLAEPPAPARTRPVPAQWLPAAAAGLADGVPEPAYALVFPLSVKRAERPAALVATGTRERLAELRDTVEVLAGQAALALDRVQLGREIRRLDNEAYFRTLIHNAADVFMIVDDRQAVRYASPSARTLFDGRDLTGTALTELVGPANEPSARAVLAGAQPGPAEWVIEPRAGEKQWVEVRSDDLRRDPTVGGVVLTLRDVTERRRLEGELRHHAYHDALTGLANRRSLQDRLAGVFEQVRHTGRVGCLLLIDLDDFKDVNDTKGHNVGDELLTAVANRLRARVRPQDLAARLGGDEFAVLVPDAAGPAEADVLARRLTHAFDLPFALTGGAVSTGASIGVASTRDSDSADELLRNADLALYAAKADGKRRWRYYDPGLHDQVLERTALRENLTRAIEEGALALHYQPVVEIGDGRVSGFEALARWPHPVRGLVGPEVFIPLAEETGQILPLGRLLMRQAVTAAAAWNRARTRAGAREGDLGVPALHIAVNVSLRQLRDRAFTMETTGLLEAAGLRPELLVLELTESDLMKHHDRQARRTLAMLRERGVRIAIDDFGTGYSSLSYLRELPIDILKIDKSFIADITTSAEQAALVEGIIRIADGLGLSVVAEGVETQEQWDLLGGCDCDYGQGYLFAPPMSADQVGGMLAACRDPRLPQPAGAIR